MVYRPDETLWNKTLVGMGDWCRPTNFRCTKNFLCRRTVHMYCRNKLTNVSEAKVTWFSLIFFFFLPTFHMFFLQEVVAYSLDTCIE